MFRVDKKKSEVGFRATDTWRRLVFAIAMILMNNARDLCFRFTVLALLLHKLCLCLFALYIILSINGYTNCCAAAVAVVTQNEGKALKIFTQ